jgi:ADP-ribose pyrophosphatase YjhB (NUDIX family)
MSDLPIRLFIATKALIQYQGLVLILRESNKYVDGTQTGKFDVPGGRMTVMGESYLDSLRREVFEESGLEIDAITPFF